MTKVNLKVLLKFKHRGYIFWTCIPKKITYKFTLVWEKNVLCFEKMVRQIQPSMNICLTGLLLPYNDHLRKIFHKTNNIWDKSKCVIWNICLYAYKLASLYNKQRENFLSVSTLSELLDLLKFSWVTKC